MIVYQQSMHTAEQVSTATIETESHRVEHGIHIGGLYAHRNGNKYKVLSIACNTEDLSWSVIYEALYENKVSQVWCRKLEDFLAVITLEDGTQQLRFIYQGQAQ